MKKSIILPMVGWLCIATSGCEKAALVPEAETENSIPDDNTSERASLGSFDFDRFDGETSSTSGATIDNRVYFNPSTTDNQFYFDVSTQGYRVFKCFAPDRNRTEVKEKNGNEASLSTAKDMEYIAKLENIPNNGVTVAQIHNRGAGVNRPLTRVYVESGRFYVKTTTNDPSSSSGTYTTYTGPTYTSGSDYTLRITTSGGSATVYITTTTGSGSTIITPTSSWNNYSTKYYLKAGVYTEGNDKEPKLSMKGFDM